MPVWVQDEDIWQKAKSIAEDEGHENDWPYITSIYKSLGGRVQSENLDRFYESFIEKDLQLTLKDYGGWKRLNKDDEYPKYFLKDTRTTLQIKKNNNGYVVLQNLLPIGFSSNYDSAKRMMSIAMTDEINKLKGE